MRAHRTITFLPALLASFAFVTSFIFGFLCDSIQFELLPAERDSHLLTTLHLGPYYQKETRYVDAAPGNSDYMVQENNCVAWTSNRNTDAALRLVRTLGVLAPLVGGLLAIVLWLRVCLVGRLSTRTWRIIAGVYLLVVTPLQALTFLLFRSNACRDNPVVAELEQEFAREVYNSRCAWDQGSTANVFSVALWLATGIVLLVVGAPQRPPPTPPQTQAVTYERTTLPDGTVAVQEVAVVKGTAVSPSPKV